MRELSAQFNELPSGISSVSVGAVTSMALSSAAVLPAAGLMLAVMSS
jgi:hypothetical protein